MKRNNKKLVYTVLTNNYETPVDIVKEDGWDYICMTDSRELKSDKWTIKLLPNWVMEMPENKRQRIVKILPHLFFFRIRHIFICRRKHEDIEHWTR